LLFCPQVTEKKKKGLHEIRRNLDPINLAKQIEEKLGIIFERVDHIESEREELPLWAGES